MKHLVYVSYYFLTRDKRNGFGGCFLRYDHMPPSEEDMDNAIKIIKDINKNFEDCVILSIDEIRQGSYHDN